MFCLIVVVIVCFIDFIRVFDILFCYGVFVDVNFYFNFLFILNVLSFFKFYFFVIFWSFLLVVINCGLLLEYSFVGYFLRDVNCFSVSRNVFVL